jgi:hypothetical protein
VSINPYESPAEPKLDLPGVRYRVDQRKLSLSEHCQLTQYPLKGLWRWLSLRLGLVRDPTHILIVPRVAEMATALADMPPQVAERLLSFHHQAAEFEFFGQWTSTIMDQHGHALCCILRMLSHDPRVYLEIAYLAVDRVYISRHNLVSATTGGEFLVTSNGTPSGRRAPVVKAQYARSLPFDQLLSLHRQRIDAWPHPFREMRSCDDMNGVVQDLVNSFVDFQIARGYYTPLEKTSEQ